MVARGILLLSLTSNNKGLQSSLGYQPQSRSDGVTAFSCTIQEKSLEMEDESG